MKQLALFTALIPFVATGVSAQTFPPEPVAAGWQSVDLTTDDIDGTLRVTWTVQAGLGNLTVICGAWATDAPDLAAFAGPVLAQSTASEGDRPLLSSLSHFAAAGDLSSLEGAPAPCRQTTAVSTGGVRVTIREGETLVPVTAASQ